MQVFQNLIEANDRRYGTSFDSSEQMSNALVPGCFILCDFPGCFILCDSGEGHDNCYKRRYRFIEELFTEGDYKFKLYADPEAHMTVMDNLPEACDE